MSEINILLVSDDHGIPGFEKAFAKAKKLYGKIDVVIHSGDSDKMDDSYYTNLCKCPFYMVRGNNDYNDCRDTIIVSVAGKRILVTHGHRYGVYSGTQRLFYGALENKADVAVYGHTHIPFYEEVENVVIVNPGSLTLPRNSRIGSFAVMTIDDEGKIIVEHETLG